MNRLSIALLGLILGVGAAADDAGIEGGSSRWSAGLFVGTFDMDTQSSDDPHLNEIDYGVMLSYQPSRFWALDGEIGRMEFAREYDSFGVKTGFGAINAGLTGRVIWPMDDDFSLYLRAGLYHFELDEGSQLEDVALDASVSQAGFGFGVRGSHWFIEYVNHGKVEDLILEQVRAGFTIRF